MDNALLFECMRRVYEMHSQAKAIDPEQMQTMVQKSKGDSTYSLGVACAFKYAAGDKWDVFCDIYNTSMDKTKHLSDSQLDICRSELQKFWHKIKRAGREEFVSVANWYLRIKEAA